MLCVRCNADTSVVDRIASELTSSTIPLVPWFPMSW